MTWSLRNLVPAYADPMTRVSQSPANPLASPVWWLAVVTLLINDHVLKTAGLLPGVITGKLSDFAGLVVAPVLLVALLRANALSARLACFGAVAVGFSIVKLSDTAAAGAAGALGAIGIPSRIIADPTDLMALAVLPAAFLLTTPRPAPVEIGPARSLVGRAGLVVGMIACMATSQNPVTSASNWQTTSFLLNSTGAPLDVRIRYYDGTLNCEEIGDKAPHALAPSAFGEGVRFNLGVGHSVPLSQPDVLEAAGQEQSPNDPPPACEIALIQSDGMPSIIAWWSNLTEMAVPTVITDLESRPHLLDGAVTLVIENGNLTATPRGLVKTDIAKEAVGASTCPAQGESFQWSHVTFSDGEFTLVSVESLPDGCADIGLVYVGGDPAVDTHRLTLCIPAGVFTFQPGEQLTFVRGGNSLEFASATKTVFIRNNQSDRFYPLRADMTLKPMDCDGDRMECGGFSVPVSFVPSGGAAIKPGTEAMVEGIDGNQVRLIVGRSEQVLAAREACEPGRQTLGIKADYIVVVEEGGI